MCGTPELGMMKRPSLPKLSPLKPSEAKREYRALEHLYDNTKMTDALYDQLKEQINRALA